MELTGREGEVVLLAMARARMISPQTVQNLSSLLYSLPLQSSLKSDYCLLISLDPAAHLHMELHYSCGAWHPTRSPLASHRPRRGRPTGARDRRASPLRPARILSLRPPNRPSQSQRKHLESNLEGGRKTDRQTEREARPPPLEGSGGNRSRPSIRSSAQSAAEEIKFSAGDLFPFSCQRSTARRLARSSLACEWRSRRGDGRTDIGRPACLFARLFRSSLHENQLLRSAKEKRFI